jgi:hypothetical protein
MAANFSKLGKNIGKQISDSVRKRYIKTMWKELTKGVTLVSIILDLIKKGISPTAAGRFLKYSQGYINRIKGIAQFKTRDGEDVKFKAPGTKGLGVGKKQSPVSMRLTGKMLDSLTFNSSTGKLGFGDKKAKWHNEGDGNLPVRRLLPTNPGERFNRRAEQRIRDGLSEAVRKEAKNPANFLSIKIKLK